MSTSKKTASKKAAQPKTKTANHGKAQGKEKQAHSKVEEANKAALKHAKFDRARILEAFDKMAAAHGTETESANARKAAAIVICHCADDFATAAVREDKATRETALKAWQEWWKLLYPELLKRKSPFVEKSDTGKTVMTQYGKNVASTARGVVEFGVPTKTDDGKDRRYSDILEEVKDCRRDSASQTEKDIRNAREMLTAAIKRLRKRAGKDLSMMTAITSLIEFTESSINEYGAHGMAAILHILSDDENPVGVYAEALRDDAEAAAESDSESETEENDAELPGSTEDQQQAANG